MNVQFTEGSSLSVLSCFLICIAFWQLKLASTYYKKAYGLGGGFAVDVGDWDEVTAVRHLRSAIMIIAIISGTASLAPILGRGWFSNQTVFVITITSSIAIFVNFGLLAYQKNRAKKYYRGWYKG